MSFTYNFFTNIKNSLLPPPILVHGPVGKKRASTNTNSPFYTNTWAVNKLKKKLPRR